MKQTPRQGERLSPFVVLTTHVGRMEKNAGRAPYLGCVRKNKEPVERKSVMDAEAELPPIKWEKVGRKESLPTGWDSEPEKPSKKQKYKPRHRSKKSGKALYLFSLAMLALAIALGSVALWQTFGSDIQAGQQRASEVKNFHKVTCVSDVAKRERADTPPKPKPVRDRETIGVLHVPDWKGMQIPIKEGVSGAVLDQGFAGHYPTTAREGEVGNFSVAAHRRTSGSNFRRIDTLSKGKQVVVETRDAFLVYEVTGHQIVDPKNTSVIAPVPNKPDLTPTERLMTMTTCHPEYGNSERYIVHLKLKYWTDKKDGKPKILSETICN